MDINLAQGAACFQVSQNGIPHILQARRMQNQPPGPCRSEFRKNHSLAPVSVHPTNIAVHAKELKPAENKCQYSNERSWFPKKTYQSSTFKVVGIIGPFPPLLLLHVSSGLCPLPEN